MSGGYGSGGYPGQGYDAPDYDGDPRRARPRRQGDGGQQQRDDSGWRNDQADEAPGYGGQDYTGQGYGDPRHDGGAYGAPGYDPRGYGQQGTGGYRSQGTGPQSGRYGGTGGRPEYDRPEYDGQGSGPRRVTGGYDQRGGSGNGYGQGGTGGLGREEGDSSFLPGFGRRDEFDDGRAGRAPERDDRYDNYGDPRDPRGGRPEGRGPGAADRGGRGPGDRGPGGPDPRARDDRRRDDWDDRNRQPRRKATRWLPRILILTVVAVIVIGGLAGGLSLYHKYESRYHPADYAGQGTGDVTVQVMSGDTSFSLAPRLLQLGVIASTRAFTNAAKAAPTTTVAGSTGLEAGYYLLHHHMQASLAYTALLNPKNRVQTTVAIPEGKRVSQVLTILAKYTKIPLAQFETAAKDTAALGLPSYAGTTVAGRKLPATVPYGSVEGYLFPATYAIVPHETPLQILQAMVARFNVEAQQIGLPAAAAKAGLTPDELIIEASMVQAEAGLNSDMPKMARVMLNRKAKDMPYGFDSVVYYGLGKYGINITPSQAAAAGLYNNTQQLGLPPTAIGNPGDAAIQAVLHPVSGPWLYFLTTATGKATQFSATCTLAGTCG